MDIIHMIRPLWAWLLLPLLGLIIGLWFKRQTSQQWQQVCDPHLLPHLLVQLGQPARQWRLLALSCAWFIGVFALMGPAWQKIEIPAYQQQQARVIALDLSPAMYAADVKPDRLTRAKYKIRDLLNLSGDRQVGMVAFASEAYTVSPLTQDVNTITAMLPELSPIIMPVQGSDIKAALIQAQELIEQNNQSDGDIIVVTANSASAQDIELAKQLMNKGYSISVLGVGTPQGALIPTERGVFRVYDGSPQISKLDKASLQRLAQAGGGRYVELTDNIRDVSQLAAQRGDWLASLGKEQMLISEWDDKGRWFILLLLPFAAYAFRRGIW
jgi:Ca-activated chloride channel family protein